MISQKTVQDVFEQAKIEEVVGDFLNLRRRGSNLIGLCPFHDEKTPSFNVSPSRNIFKCFGCGRGGDSVKFIMEHERYTFPEAIRFLAGKYNIPIEETRPSAEEELTLQETESLRIVNEFALKFFVDQLHQTEDGRAIGLSYFKERGFLNKTIESFQLGYAPEGDALRQAAKKEGFTEERLKTLGLITQSGRDMYRNRVVFPIHNLTGKVIAFGARALKSGPREPKYINSPESVVYSKRKVLYGMHLAKHVIRKQDVCFLVEGYTDVISLMQAGIENVVSSSGTALTVEQIKIIRRFTQNITVLYDGDAAGVKAALRGLDLLLEEDMYVRLVMLPEKDDPDSLVRRLGRDAFLEFLKNETKDFILFKTSLLSEESKHDPVRRSILVREIVQSIALIPDPIRRATYLKECSSLLEMDERILIQETGKAIDGNLKKRQQNRERDFRPPEDAYRHEDPETTTAQPKRSRPSTSERDGYQERAIVRLLIQSGSEIADGETGITVAQYIIDNIRDVLDSFDNALYGRIAQRYADALAQGTIPRQEELRMDPDREIADLALELIAEPDEYSENWLNARNLPLLSQRPPEENFGLDSQQTVLRFKEFKIQKHIDANKLLIEQYQKEHNSDALSLHLKMHKELSRMKQEITAALNSIGIRL